MDGNKLWLYNWGEHTPWFQKLWVSMLNCVMKNKNSGKSFLNTNSNKPCHHLELKICKPFFTSFPPTTFHSLYVLPYFLLFCSRVFLCCLAVLSLEWNRNHFWRIEKDISLYWWPLITNSTSVYFPDAAGEQSFMFCLGWTTWLLCRLTPAIHQLLFLFNWANSYPDL